MGRLRLNAIRPYTSLGMKPCGRLSMDRRCKKITTTGRSPKQGLSMLGQNKKREDVEGLVRQCARRKSRERAKEKESSGFIYEFKNNACVLIPLHDEKVMAWLIRIVTNR
jgi:hypothetical protein